MDDQIHSQPRETFAPILSSPTTRVISLVLLGGLALTAGLTGCTTSSADTPIHSSQSASPKPSPITAAQISTIQDGLKWAAALPDTTTSVELRAGAKVIDDLVPRDKIWFATGNTIGQDIAKLNLGTFRDKSFAAVNVAEMKRIAIEIHTAIEHGNKP
jgi:hypothetical protein